MGLLKKAKAFVKKTVKKTKSFVEENAQNAFMYGSQIGAGMGLYNEREKQKAKKKELEALGAERDSLLGSLSELDPESRSEVKELLKNGLGNVAKASEMFTQAKAGVLPKYKARIATQKMYDIMVDRPGEKQTRDSGYSLLMSNQFVGRGR